VPVMITRREMFLVALVVIGYCALFTLGALSP
jgi:hypothetical protein